MSEPIKAKRGDLAVIVTTRRDFYIGEGVRESTDVVVCEVTSITREGLAKVVRRASMDTPIPLARWTHPHQVYIVPKAQIDVAAAMESAAERLWPTGHPGRPYASLDEAKAALRPHKR